MSKSSNYDRREAVQRAAWLFWKKGFKQTSARDLQAELDMRPGSLYAAFQSKEGLFKEALLAYGDNMNDHFQRCLAARDSILDGMELFVYEMLISHRDQQANNACLLSKTLVELPEGDSELKDFCLQLQNQLEAHLTDCFATAQQRGELPAEPTPLSFARLYQVLLNGIRSYRNHCDDDQVIETLVRQMFRQLRNLQEPASIDAQTKPELRP